MKASIKEPKVIRSVRIEADVNNELNRRGVNVSDFCNHKLKELIKDTVCPKCGSNLKKKLTK